MYKFREKIEIDKNENEMVLVDTEKEKIYFFKSLETEIIEQLLENGLEKTILCLKDKYQADDQVIETDVKQFIKELLQKEIIVEL